MWSPRRVDDGSSVAWASGFGLLLFSTEPAVARAARGAGIDALVVDWERRGKDERQRDADTSISADTVEDLAAVREAASVPVVVRIDGPGCGVAAGVERAVAGGADLVLLPMVRRPAEVARFVDLLAGRAAAGILVETTDAVERIDDFADLALDCAYIGLTDLAIERRTGLFDPLVDGTVRRVREALDVPVGVGGVTLPGRGAPLASTLLYRSYAEHRIDFSFLRRSFHRDRAGMALPDAVAAIRAGLADAAASSAGCDEELRRAIS